MQIIKPIYLLHGCWEIKILASLLTCHTLCPLSHLPIQTRRKILTSIPTKADNCGSWSQWLARNSYFKLFRYYGTRFKIRLISLSFPTDPVHVFIQNIDAALWGLKEDRVLCAGRIFFCADSFKSWPQSFKGWALDRDDHRLHLWVRVGREKCLPQHLKEESTVLRWICFIYYSVLLILLVICISRSNCHTESDAFVNGVRAFYFASCLMASVPTLAPPEITVATPHRVQVAWTLPSNSPNSMPCVRCSSTGLLQRWGVEGIGRLLLAP